MKARIYIWQDRAAALEAADLAADLEAVDSEAQAEVGLAAAHEVDTEEDTDPAGLADLIAPHIITITIITDPTLDSIAPITDMAADALADSSA